MEFHGNTMDDHLPGAALGAIFTRINMGFLPS